jgi:predicted ATPase
MIDLLELQNFKCFLKQPFEFKPLTVFCGHNGAGKSSVIQSLLIAQQTSDMEVGGKKPIPLNGPFGMELGTVADVFCQDAKESFMEIRVRADGAASRLSFPVTDSNLENQFLSAELYDHVVPTSLQLINGFHFIYLSAERLGPRDTQTTQSRPRDELVIGAKGEFAAEILSRFERDEVRAEMCHPSATSENKLLQPQVELWMNDWTPGLQIRADSYAGTNVAAIRLKRRNVTSEWMRPTNVGFGISHSLPIVLAGLLATKGGLFIVDNPESHLHPSGQSAMGRFLATLATSGVQVIVETHSDHLLNGIRLAAKRNQMKASDAAIYYFNRSAAAADQSTTVVSPELTQDGKLTQWPEGFFDEWENALHELL